MPRYKKRWTRGDKTKLANLAGISPQYLCDIMAGRKTCDPERAIILQNAAKELGYRITKLEWCWLHHRKGNPLFPTSSPVTD